METKGGSEQEDEVWEVQDDGVEESGGARREQVTLTEMIQALMKLSQDARDNGRWADELLLDTTRQALSFGGVRCVRLAEQMRLAWNAILLEDER